mmetsp:Transcript_16328/g.45157  ORF Transcript_16328/g.45157 Transcript_16328/m.45157 type:complete len:135 (-) Transcript_16328:240-644(-)
MKTKRNRKRKRKTTTKITKIIATCNPEANEFNQNPIQKQIQGEDCTANHHHHHRHRKSNIVRAREWSETRCVRGKVRGERFPPFFIHSLINGRNAAYIAGKASPHWGYCSMPYAERNATQLSTPAVLPVSIQYC